MSRLFNFFALSALAGLTLLAQPQPAVAQQTQMTETNAGDEFIDPRAPIVIRAWREERRAINRGSENNRRLMEQAAVGLMGEMPASSVVGAIGSGATGSNPTKEAIDWQLLGMMRSGETNSPLARYGFASQMADCAVTSAGRDAADYVDLDWNGDFPNLRGAFESRHIHCVNSAARGAPAMMVNAALAELLVARFVPEPPLFAQAVDGNVADRFIHGADGNAPESDLATIGRCLAVYVPGMGYDLLYTGLGSKQEKNSLEAIYVSAPECGVKEMPGKVSKTYQRAAIAMGLFQWYGLGHAERMAPTG